MTTKPGPRHGWSTDKGVGYCLNRSRAHGKRLGHLYESKQDGVPRCSWCWKRQ